MPSCYNYCTFVNTSINYTTQAEILSGIYKANMDDNPEVTAKGLVYQDGNIWQML